MIRTVDEFGRIIIPVEMRKELNIQEGDKYQIEVSIDKETKTTNLLLIPKSRHCVFCKEKEDIVSIDDGMGNFICKNCLKKLKKL